MPIQPPTIKPFTLATLHRALRSGWQLALATRRISSAYTLVFVVAGGALLGGLFARGWTPFVLAAAGAFLLLAPITLPGFFGIARAHESGEAAPGLRAIVSGFSAAARGLWALALIASLLLLIFITDAAILYAYLIGDTPGGSAWAAAGSASFVLWSLLSGAIVAALLFVIAAFAVPLLCERRSGLVNAVVLSVRAVLGSWPAALGWAVLLAAVLISSCLLLPVLPLTLPWLAYASRALYLEVLPSGTP